MKRALPITILVLALVASAQAAPIGTVFDYTHGLYLNKPAADGAVTQTGVDGWWYHTGPSGFNTRELSASDMDPDNYALITVGKDGDGDAYGYGPVNNGRAYWFNGDWDNRGTENGLLEGTCIWSGPENDYSPIVEWRSDAAQLIDIDIDLEARASSDENVHATLFHYDASAETSTKLAYEEIDQLHGPTNPVVFSVSQLEVEADDGIFLFNAVGDHDADDGMGVRGTITVVPEPATMVLLGLGGAAALIRRKK